MATVEERWQEQSRRIRNRVKPPQVRVIVSYEDREIVLTGVIERLELSRETYGAMTPGESGVILKPVGPTYLELRALINETVVDVEDETGEG